VDFELSRIASPEAPLGASLATSDFDAGEQIGRLIGKEVRVDRGEHRVRISPGKLNVAGRDLDRIRRMTIFAGLSWRAQIAPTNFDLLHARYSHHPRPSRALALGAKTILRDLSAVSWLPLPLAGRQRL
jgi:hypothetical protein